MGTTLKLLAAIITFASLVFATPSWEMAERERQETFEQYSQFAAQFNRELAGRYPFAGPESIDASISTVCEFFRYYGNQLEPLRIRLDSLKTHTTQAGFVKELIAAHTFLAGTACSRFNQPIRINFAPSDTAPRSSHPPRIWMLTDDFGRARSPHGIPFMDWRFGSPIALEVRWSEQTGLRPRSARPEDDFTTPDSASIRFSERGPWALMRFIETRGTRRPYWRGDNSTSRFREKDTSLSVSLGFTAPLVSIGGTSNPSAPNLSTSRAQEMQLNESRTDLRIKLKFETSTAGKPRQYIQWPQPFPRVAPALNSEKW